MNDREKLVELLGHLEYHYCQSHSIMRENVVDYLISNGVTIREPGEWETDKEDIEWGNALKRKHCSRCGKRPHFDKEKREFVLSDFCPNCGAPMKGESK